VLMPLFTLLQWDGPCNLSSSDSGAQSLKLCCLHCACPRARVWCVMSSA
jgi:hypothetical protein